MTSAAPRVTLGNSDLSVSPLALGGGVFGWTADEATSFEVLDAYLAAGGNFIDTADVYSAWAQGNSGGESETIIGNWMRARGNRGDVILASKVGAHAAFRGLSAGNIGAAVDASLTRLGTDHLDLYYAHFDDENTPLAETVEALSALVDAGKVRAIGASNYRRERLAEWYRVTEEGGFHLIAAFQPEYNLMERDYETTTRSLVEDRGVAAVPYSALAGGFLTGKHRADAAVDSARAGQAAKYLDERGHRVLTALNAVADSHGVRPATAALAWLAAQPTVAAPITSARTAAQLPDLLGAVSLELTPDELDRLTVASEPPS